MNLAELFDTQFEIDPLDGPRIGEQLAAVPDKPAVYLLATEDDQPVLLASGQAVRTILKRRLAERIAPGDGAGPQAGGATASPRADLRPIVRRLHLHRTFSQFETDLWYLWLARKLYGPRADDLLPRRRCWMVHGDASEQFPRLAATWQFSPAGGRRVGPLPDRRSAGLLVDTLTDLFDLCRYYSILRKAPRGQPCEYKEMGKSTAACDGSVSMEHYRGQVADALDFAADRGRDRLGRWTQEMSAAAKGLRFEQAGRIKDRIARARAAMDQERYRWLMDVEAMNFLVVQPGAKKAELRTFRSFGGRLVAGPTLARKDPRPGLEQWGNLVAPVGDASARADEAGLLADYLFREGHARGLLIHYTGQHVGELAERVKAEFAPPPATPPVTPPAAPPVT